MSRVGIIPVGVKLKMNLLMLAVPPVNRIRGAAGTVTLAGNVA